MDENQLNRLCEIFSSGKRIYVYGRGSSGLAAREMNIEAISDNHVMKMNSVLLDNSCAVIGISVSGKTQEVVDSLKAAKSAGSDVILLTSHKNKEQADYCDEVILLALRENLESGNVISPQFPILVMIDIFYSHFLRYDTKRKAMLHDYTLNILQK